MSYVIPAAVAVLATVCTVCPNEIVDSGVRSNHHAKHAVPAAAACVAHNLDAGASLFATERKLSAGEFEIVGWLHPQYAAVVVHLDHGDDGARVSIWTRHYGFPPRRDEFVRRTLEGC